MENKHKNPPGNFRPGVPIIPLLNSNCGQIWLMIEVEVIGNSIVPFLKIISLLLT